MAKVNTEKLLQMCKEKNYSYDLEGYEVKNLSIRLPTKTGNYIYNRIIKKPTHKKVKTRNGWKRETTYYPVTLEAFADGSFVEDFDLDPDTIYVLQINLAGRGKPYRWGATFRIKTEPDLSGFQVIKNPA